MLVLHWTCPCSNFQCDLLTTNFASCPSQAAVYLTGDERSFMVSNWKSKAHLLCCDNVPGANDIFAARGMIPGMIPFLHGLAVHCAVLKCFSSWRKNKGEHFYRSLQVQFVSVASVTGCCTCCISGARNCNDSNYIFNCHKYVPR